MRYINVMYYHYYLNAISKNSNNLNFEHGFCSKITSNKIVHYSSIFIVNMSKIRLRLLELLTIKSVTKIIT